MQALWKETKEVALQCGLTVTVKVVGTPEDPGRMDIIREAYHTDMAEERIRTRREIAKKHGSVAAAFDAWKEDAVEEGQQALRNAATDEARALVQQKIDEAEKAGPADLVTWRMRTAERFSQYVRDIVIAGVIYDGKSGEDAYHALHAVGGPAGVKHAFDAVMTHNSVRGQTGEG